MKTTTSTRLVVVAYSNNIFLLVVANLQLKNQVY